MFSLIIALKYQENVQSNNISTIYYTNSTPTKHERAGVMAGSTVQWVALGVRVYGRDGTRHRAREIVHERWYERWVM